MIYIGYSCYSKALKPVNWTFNELADKLSIPERFNVRLSDFLKLGTREQTNLKNNQYLIACEVRFPSRELKYAINFNLLAIDLDSDLTFNVGKLPEQYAWIVYTTAKHSFLSPRYRILVKVDKTPAFNYQYYIDSFCKEYGINPSKESYNIVLPMFFPKLPKDSVYFFKKNIVDKYWKPEQPPDLYKVDSLATNKETKSPDILIYKEPPLSISDSEIVFHLSRISPECDYDTWRNVGAALKHQFQNEIDKGFQIFDEWSKSRHCSKYNKGQTTKQVYEALKPYPEVGRPVTFAHVLKLSKKSRVKLKAPPEMPDWMRKSRQLPDLPPTSEQFEEKKDRKLLELEEDQREVEESKSIFTIFKNFVYVSNANEYYDFVSQEKFKIASLEPTFGRFFPPSIKVAPYLTRLDHIPKVLDYVYIPEHRTKIPPIKNLGGINYVNTYRKNSFRGSLLTDPIYAKSILDAHFDWLFPGDFFKQNILKSFIAYPVKTCQRVCWAIVIQGISGIGKNFIFKIIKAIVGENVSLLDARHVLGTFNNWAASTQFVVIDELRREGTFKFFDSLRTNITNEDLTIEQKYQDLKSNVVNPSTYMMFTEHKSALKKDTTDRRYLPLWSPITPETLSTYKKNGGFNKLVELCEDKRNHRAIHDYFFNLTLCPEFNPNHPPLVRESNIIATMSQGSIELLIDEVIEMEVHPYINPMFVGIHHLYRYLLAQYPKEKFDMLSLVEVLTELGYVKLKTRIMLDNIRSTVYIKNTYNITETTITDYLTSIKKDK